MILGPKTAASAKPAEPAGAAPGGVVDHLDQRRVRPVRQVLLYAALVVLPIALMVVVLWATGLSGPSAATGHWRLPPLNPVSRALLTLAVIVGVTRAVGALAGRLGQPEVVGEIVGGIVLGPSVLQALWPGIGHALFSATTLSSIDMLSLVGVVLLVFLAGLEVRPSALAGRTSSLVVIGHASMAVPMLCGVALGVAGYGTFAPHDVKGVPFALFIGVATSITALPVLARILDEHQLIGTPVASLALSCAAMNDVVAWCVLAFVLALIGAGSIAATVTTVLLTAVLVAVLLLAGRRLHRSGRRDGALSVAMVLVALLAVAGAANWTGTDAVFGAFLLGAAIPAESVSARRFREAAGLLQPLLLPVFFALSGLRTDITQLGTDPVLWGWCLLVVAVAMVAKLGATTLAAKALGMGGRDALRLGGLMNCRGLTEIIVLNIGLSAGIIDSRIFTMFVIMALVSTVLTSVFLREGRGRGTAGPPAAAAGKPGAAAAGASGGR